MKRISRRDFLKTVAVGGTAVGFGSSFSALSVLKSTTALASVDKPVVSVVRIKNGNIDYAVRKAIDLLGGMKTITTGKERIMLKPNLVGPDPRNVTKPEVIKALAKLMVEARKDVCIGEGSAASYPNIRPDLFGGVCRTTDREMLERIQQSVFDVLGYSELAKELKARLINLHTGNMSKISLPDGFVFKEISLHQSLVDTDLLCSVPIVESRNIVF